jgi:hypothetical protein
MYKRQYAAPKRNVLPCLLGFIRSKGEPQLKYLYGRANKLGEERKRVMVKTWPEDALSADAVRRIR